MAERDRKLEMNGLAGQKKKNRKNVDARHSDIVGFNVMLLKATLSRTNSPIELEKWEADIEQELEDSQEQYVIFSVLYRDQSPDYFPEMFMNVSQNFLFADESLRSDLTILLDITK